MNSPDCSSDVSRVRTSSWLWIPFILVGANLRAPITSLGPVLPGLQADLHLSGSAAGVLNALPLVVFAVLSLFAPRWGRRFGLETVLGVALAAIMLGTLTRSLPASSLLWAGTVVLSAGIACGNVLLPGMVKRDHPQHASSLIGFYAAAMAGVAGLAAGLAVPIARVDGLGWRWAIGCWAVLAFVALMAWLPLWRAQAGVPSRTVSDVAPVRQSSWRHPIGWQVSLFFAAHSMVFYSLVDWYPSYAASRGTPLETSGFYLLVYQVVAVATNLGSVSLIKRFRDQRALGLACGLAMAVGTAGLLFAPRYALAWLVFAGLGAGIAMVTSLSLFALRTRDHHQASALSGMAQCVGYLGAAAGPLLVGMLHDITGAWMLPLVFLVGASLLAGWFAYLAGRDRTF